MATYDEEIRVAIIATAEDVQMAAYEANLVLFLAPGGTILTRSLRFSGIGSPAMMKTKVTGSSLGGMRSVPDRSITGFTTIPPLGTAISRHEVLDRC